MTTTIPDERPATELDPRLAGVQTEAKLGSWSLSYEYVADFPIAAIHVAPWAQVRSADSLADKETLSEFRTQMMMGTVYPPIIIMEPDTLVDGNHRFAAAKMLHRTSLPAFVVSFNSVDLAKSFAAACNQMGGRRLTTSEAYQAATTMMARGMADESIARELGRSASGIRDMRKRNEFADRTAAIPEIAKVAASISEKGQIRLTQIRHDPAFAEAVKLVADTHAPVRTVSEIVQAATKARTDADAITAVRALRAQLAPAGPPPKQVTIPPEVRQANMHLGGLLKLASNPVAMLDTSSPERRAESLGKWRQLAGLAGRIIGLYEER